MATQYDDMQGDEMDAKSHPANNVPQATEHYAGDVQPLHPVGTFSRNTQGGDIINGMAQSLGVSNPPNVIKFPKKTK